MSREIPVGTLVELRGSNEDWRVVSYWDNEMPKFCRQYMIMNTNTGATKRVFKHEIYEKDTSTYQDIHAFFREQLSQEIKEDFLNSSMSDTHEEHSFTLDDLIQPHDTEMNESPVVRNPQSPVESPAQSPHQPLDESPIRNPQCPAGSPAQSPPQPPLKRFKAITDEDVESLASKTTEATTNSMTKWAIKLFKEWIEENEGSETHNLNNLSVEQLDAYLAKFYASLQTKKGKDYSKSALTGLRAGINRFYRQPPNNKQFNILKDREFQKSNNVLMGIIKELKRAGKDTAENKEPISQQDLKKMQASGLLSVGTPQTLQNKVLFDIMTHFGRRGREGLRSLKPESFKFATDSEGHRYVAMSFNEADKTHHGVDSKEKPKAPRMYETKGESCPVKAFEKYLSKLNPANQALFQKPLIKFHMDGPVWYSKVPVGVNYLYDFMPRMSAEAGLSRRYTNHCIRAMVASTLSCAGVSNMGIMSVTGHRNVQSLNSYIKPSDSERRTISGILTGDQDSNLALTQVTRPQFAPQSRFHNYPTRPCDNDFHSSQFNSQSNSRFSSFSIFSGPVTGGHVSVHIYKH